MTNFRNFIKEQLHEPEMKAKYDVLEPEFRAIRARIETERMVNNPNAPRFKTVDELFEELDT